MTTLTYLAREARIASLRALIERERVVRLAHLHTGSDEDLLELYLRSDAAADAAGDAWIKLVLACQAADAKEDSRG